MSEIIIRFIIGFSISLGLGTWLTPIFLKAMREYVLEILGKPSDIQSYGVLDWLLGFVERGFFTIVVAFNVSGAAVAMISWVLIKMLTNWHRIIDADPDSQPLNRGLALCSLMGSMISLFFALIGGLVARV